jgi:predicted RNase H-like HicB family nuclease
MAVGSQAEPRNQDNWTDADGAIIAEVPQLPGCAADGATYQEALENVEIVIREWIETAKELGRPMPAPRGGG